jgi:hypothetical protein
MDASIPQIGQIIKLEKKSLIEDKTIKFSKKNDHLYSQTDPIKFKRPIFRKNQASNYFCAFFEIPLNRESALTGLSANNRKFARPVYVNGLTSAYSNIENTSIGSCYCLMNNKVKITEITNSLELKNSHKKHQL